MMCFFKFYKKLYFPFIASLSQLCVLGAELNFCFNNHPHQPHAEKIGAPVDESIAILVNHYEAYIFVPLFLTSRTRFLFSFS